MPNLRETLRGPVVTMWDEGMVAPDIAAALGRGTSTIYRVLRDAGIHPGEANRRIERIRKHDSETRRRISADYAAGEPMSLLVKRYGCGAGAIRKACTENGVILRNQGGRYRTTTAEQRTEMVTRYERGETQEHIAEQLHVHQSRVSRMLRDAGVSGRRPGPPWGGQAIRSTGGYMMIRVLADSPFAAMRNVQGYVMEHRLVVARSLGRPLTTAETVHHINGDKTDNRIENLQLRRGKHGKHEAFVCADCGSHNVVSASLD